MQLLAPEQADVPNDPGTLLRSKRGKLRSNEVAGYGSRFLKLLLGLLEEVLVFIVPEIGPKGLYSLKWVGKVSRRLPRFPKCQCIGCFLPKIGHLVETVHPKVAVAIKSDGPANLVFHQEQQNAGAGGDRVNNVGAVHLTSGQSKVWQLDEVCNIDL